MNRFLTRSNKVVLAIGILELVIVVSLLIVASSGCAKKSAEKKQVSPKTTKTPRPTTTAPNPSSVDLSKYFPSDEKLKAKLFADVNKDGNKEIIFLSGKSWDVNLQDPFLMTIHILTWDGSKYVSSWEQKTEGEVSQELKVEDINKDSTVEILSYQVIGNSPRLYVVSWNGSSYDFLKPVGGNSYFQGFFGLKGAKLKDDDNDGVKEIYGYYGPAGSQADIYKWDGKNYTYSRTVSIER
jgi:hypothetical protein